MFGVGVRELNKLQASGLIDRILWAAPGFMPISITSPWQLKENHYPKKCLMLPIIKLGFNTLAASVVCLCPIRGGAEEPSTAKAQVSTIPPTFADVSYGPEPQQVLDFWQAKSSKPTPLIFNIHGGGWIHGTKEPLGREQGFLQRGISVVHITYRFTPANPLPAPVMDAARALQFVCSKAVEWNIDPKRVILSGFSAGGTIFVAFLAYCLHVTLRHRLRKHAPGLTPRAAIEKLATIQMLDAYFPTTDGRCLIFARYTQPEKDHRMLLDLLGLQLPAQKPPRITGDMKLMIS